jgi:hypothetical protein
MDRFVARKNIKRYRRMPAAETDEARRRILRDLLVKAEEDLSIALLRAKGGANPMLWRERAEEARAQAEMMRHAETRRIMLDIAEDYEKLAKDAEALFAADAEPRLQ